MSTNLTQFYDDLKQSLNNNSDPANNVVKVGMQSGGFNTSPNALAWRNKAANCCDTLKDNCCKQLLVNLYCNILPLDKDFIDGNQNLMKQDIDSMLANKGMTATQYLKSCYESTKAPLLEYILRSVNNIGKTYMEEADEILKDAQLNDTAIPEPEVPDNNDKVVNSQLIEIESDTEYDNFVEELKKRTIDKIVNDVSKIINDKKEENDMTFDTTSPADLEEKLESTTSIALDYIQKRLMKEHTDITSDMYEDLIGLAIRESTLNQFDVVFKQPTGQFREYASRIRFGKGILINESAVNYFKESY